MNATLQSARQRIYLALTSPLLSYSINGASPVNLPAANVVPKAVWEIGQTPPMPLVAYNVSTKTDAGITLGRNLGVRRLQLKLWVVSGASMDEATSIYEAIRTLLNYADQDATNGAVDLSRPGSSGAALALAVQLCREVDVLPPAYEEVTKRWYLSAEYELSAI